VCDAGCALLLTNAPGFWRPGSGRATAFEEFRLHEGCRLQGTRGWGASAGASTRKSREAPIELDGSYEPRWRNFSEVEGVPFRWLAIVAG